MKPFATTLVERQFKLAHACLWAGLALSLGCNAGSDLPATYPVAGVVSWQGSAVSEAVVTFHPVGSGQSATAYTDNDGKFAAMTYFDNGRKQVLGMLPGEYQVTVTKLEQATGSLAGAPPKNLLPDKYAQPGTSQLSFRVGESSDNLCELAL
jgi:hypothetical protein